MSLDKGRLAFGICLHIDPCISDFVANIKRKTDNNCCWMTKISQLNCLQKTLSVKKWRTFQKMNKISLINLKVIFPLSYSEDENHFSSPHFSDWNTIGMCWRVFSEILICSLLWYWGIFFELARIVGLFMEPRTFWTSLLILDVSDPVYALDFRLELIDFEFEDGWNE